MLCVSWDREVLYERINRRVDIMLDEGLLDEVRGLMDKGYTKELNSMKGIGYKEVMDYLDGAISYEEMVETVKQSSRRYAKRQLTWFRRDERIHWLNADNALDEAMELVKKFVN